MSEGWHCLHLYYRVDQQALKLLDPVDIAHGRAEVTEILNPTQPDAPAQLQTSVISGHRADLGVMVMDPDPLKIDSIQQRIRAADSEPC
jgi:chlorite dismutase